VLNEFLGYSRSTNSSVTAALVRTSIPIERTAKPPNKNISSWVLFLGNTEHFHSAKYIADRPRDRLPLESIIRSNLYLVDDTMADDASNPNAPWSYVRFDTSIVRRRDDLSGIPYAANHECPSHARVKSHTAFSRRLPCSMFVPQGSFVMELYHRHAPRTCYNVAGLAHAGYYDGVTFHRIVRDQIVQGGDPTGTGRGGESIYGGTFEGSS
jgi:hypothetical protein